MMVVIYACTVPVFSSSDNAGLYTQCKTNSGDQNLYKYKSELLNGTAKSMNDYMGQISLVVNVASFWGLTNTTYHFLNALAAKYGGNSQCSLKIIAFPCNQFAYQEPATAVEIPKFLEHVRPGNGYKPAFDLFKKIDVNGKDEDPIFTMLKDACPRPNPVIADFPGQVLWRPIKFSDIYWNFEKVLVDHQGKPLFRYHVVPNAYNFLEGHIKSAINTCQSAANKLIANSLYN